MKGLFELLGELGVSKSEFERISGVTYPTLKKMSEGHPVQFLTRCKVENALKLLKARIASESAYRTQQFGR